jgi:hypothetical protein
MTNICQPPNPNTLTQGARSTVMIPVVYISIIIISHSRCVISSLLVTFLIGSEENRHCNVILIGYVELDVASRKIAVVKGKCLCCLFLCAHVPVVLY